MIPAEPNVSFGLRSFPNSESEIRYRRSIHCSSCLSVQARVVLFSALTMSEFVFEIAANNGGVCCNPCTPLVLV